MCVFDFQNREGARIVHVQIVTQQKAIPAGLGEHGFIFLNAVRVGVCFELRRIDFQSFHRFKSFTAYEGFEFARAVFLWKNNVEKMTVRVNHPEVLGVRNSEMESQGLAFIQGGVIRPHPGRRFDGGFYGQHQWTSGHFVEAHRSGEEQARCGEHED